MGSSSVAHLIGVSIPRSGHHYLARLLQASLGERLHYCEFYMPLACCRGVPCCRPGRAAIVYQKNHDFDLSLSTGLAQVLYVVQTRAPVPEALSDRELLETVQPELRGDRDDLVTWLGRKAAYTIRFQRKWIVEGPANRVHVPYEQLVQDPGGVVREVLARAGIPVAPEAIAAAVARHASRHEDAKLGAFTAREATPAAELQPAYRAFVEVIAAGAGAPSVGAEELGTGEALAVRLAAAGHGAIFDQDWPGAVAAWGEFCRMFPENPHGHVMHALVLEAAGQPREAVRSALRAARVRPVRLAALRRARDSLSKQGRHRVARRVSEALVALAPEQPVHLISLANDTHRAGDAPAALLASRRFVEVARAVPVDAAQASKVWALRSHAHGFHVAEFWRDACEIFLASGARRAAQEAAEIAFGMSGGRADMAALVARVAQAGASPARFAGVRRWLRRT